MDLKNLIKGPQEFAGGLIVLLLGLAARYYASPLPLGKGADLGPGSFPVGISYILIGLGLLLIAYSIFKIGENLDWFFVRSMTLIFALAGFGFILRKFLMNFTPVPARGSSLDWSIVIATLTIVGLIFFLVHLTKTNKIAEAWVNRGPLFVTSAILVFAVLIRPLGLALSAPLLIILSAFAYPSVKLKETVIFAVVLTTLCIILFRFILNQAIPIAPWAGF